MDYLLMVAQGYQESLLDQNAKSDVGAIGVMQVMPATGKEMNTGDITKVESNIHAGIKYMSLMRNQFFANRPMDARNKILFSFAGTTPDQAVSRSFRRRLKNVGSIPTFGSITSRSSPENGSAKRR